MSAIVKHETQVVGLNEIMTLGDVFKQSGYFRDVRDQAQAVVKILYGRELGFSPVVSMMGVHIIEGKPALSANLMGAMVKRSGKYNYHVNVLTDKACELEFTEGGKKAGLSSFTMEDAQRAGVVRPGGSWAKYPRNMLFARALSNGVKLFCPELSACPVYVPEELGADVNEEGEVVELPKSELPKSAKPAIEAVKEPVTFKRKESAQQGTSTALVAADSSAVDGGAVSTQEGTASPVEPEVLPPAESDTIDKGHAVALHRAFREALPEKQRKHATELLKDFLRKQGITNLLGEPSTLAIKRESYDNVRQTVIDFAGSFHV